MNIFDKQALLKNGRELMRKHGWMGTTVQFDDKITSYTYSIGLSKKFKHPEIFVVGVGDHSLRLQLINAFGGMLKSAGFPEPSSYVDLPGFGHTFALGPVIPEEKVRPHARFGTELLGKPFSAIQLYLPDPNGLFPWDEGVHPAYREAQTLLFESPAAMLKPKAN
ncbi:DUF4262 domain-containing protein [Mesorhizobium sp. SP-1A]|uniref:DUF4262 domain-containing protein n=1 Tax=Mesorhizobium sp. SP-1A TaxID=3077840 RepID=UPI0028F6D94D|nr:DUF4262 domain-containing protein [Mesorhizobium sp. SP-1A]